MPASILSLFVVVIDRARAGSRTHVDERTFSAADQRLSSVFYCLLNLDLLESRSLRRVPFLVVPLDNYQPEREAF